MMCKLIHFDVCTSFSDVVNLLDSAPGTTLNLRCGAFGNESNYPVSFRVDCTLFLKHDKVLTLDISFLPLYVQQLMLPGPR